MCEFQRRFHASVCSESVDTNSRVVSSEDHYSVGNYCSYKIFYWFLVCFIENSVSRGDVTTASLQQTTETQ